MVYRSIIKSMTFDPLIPLMSKNYGDNWIYGGFSNFADATLPHFAGKRHLTRILMLDKIERKT